MSKSAVPQVWEDPWDKVLSHISGPDKVVSQRLVDKVGKAIEWRIDLPFEYGISTAIHILIEQKVHR